MKNPNINYSYIPNSTPLNRQTGITIIKSFLANSFHNRIGHAVIGLSSVASSTRHWRKHHKIPANTLTELEKNLKRFKYLNSGQLILETSSKYCVAKALGLNEVWKLSLVWFDKMASIRTTAKLNMAATGASALDSCIKALHPLLVVISWVEIFIMHP